MNLLEISMEADGEAAEAISQIFNRYGQGGAVVEETPGEASPRSVVIKTYLPEDGRLAQRRRQLEEAIWHLCQIYPSPEPNFRTLAERDNRPLSNFIETAALRYVEREEYVDEFEMDEIRASRTLNNSIKRGLADARAKRGRSV